MHKKYLGNGSRASVNIDTLIQATALKALQDDIAAYRIAKDASGKIPSQFPDFLKSSPKMTDFISASSPETKLREFM